MSSQQPTQIKINPTNPAQYLACCGIFEIAARFDPAAVSRWETDDAATRFLIETTINEAELVKCLVTTFTEWDEKQEVIKIDETDAVRRIDATFVLSEATRCKIKLDWWYEMLDADGSISGRSAWKMYAGNQTAEKTITAMVAACREIVSARNLITLDDLLTASRGMSGRFGFDPGSSRNALDVGYSPNDLSLNVATYPFVELLTMIAAQYFFPPRTRPGGGHESTRGFMRDPRDKKIYFQHCLWRDNLPIVLARAYACGSLANEHSGQLLKSERAMRDKYSNLSPSTQTTFKKGNTHD
jgi:CRISPR-associated protein Csx14